MAERKPITKGMSEHDVIRAMGSFPAKIHPPEDPYIFKGTYFCLWCRHRLTIDGDMLGPCPKCGNSWARVRSAAI